jgi:hypothetical protein
MFTYLLGGSAIEVMPYREDISIPIFQPFVPKGWRPNKTQTEIERRKQRRAASEKLGRVQVILKPRPFDFPDIDWTEATRELHGSGKPSGVIFNIISRGHFTLNAINYVAKWRRG